MTPGRTRLPLRLGLLLMKVIRLGDRRAEVESDFTELYTARAVERGTMHATWRLLWDILSVARAPRRGSVGQDFRFGARLIRKHPLPIGITVAGLALAIAVVNATFGITNAALLKPFNMDDPSSVVSINRPGPRAYSAWPYVQFLQWRERLTLVSAEASLIDQARFSLTANGDEGSPEYLQFVSGGYLAQFGGRTRIGRTIDAHDDVAGAPVVAVVNHHFWMTRLGGDAAIVGRTVWIGDSRVTIVGVMQPDFEGPRRYAAAFWAPLAAFDELTHSRELTAKSNELVDVVGRLEPGVSIGTAQNELTAVSASILNWQGAPDKAAQAAHLVSARSPWAARDPEDRYGAIGTIGVAGLLLVLACANAANLLLAGAVSRMREMGVRMALGASRWRLIRQLVTESLMLGVIAGGFGFLLSIWLVKIAAANLSLPPGLDATPDARVLLFAAGVAILSGVGAGLAPARFGASGDVLSALKARNGRQGHASKRSRLRLSFVGVQAAVSVFLLIAASLMTRSALRVARTPLGFDADRLLAVSLDIPRTADYYNRDGGRYNANAVAYLQSAVTAIRALPTVEGASLALYAPFGSSRATTRPFTQDGRSHALYQTNGDADFFATAGFRVVRGRGFTSDEVNSAAPVALISESVAQDFFGDTDPIGQTLKGVRTPFGDDAETTVIGLVADAMTVRPEAEREGNLYKPIGWGFNNPPTLLVRSSTPDKITRQIETALVAINPGIRPTTRVIGAQAALMRETVRTQSVLAAGVAALACVLAVLGLYGVTAFVLSQRTQEIGVRLTLGATAGEIFGLLIRQSLRPVAIGLVVGLGAALASSRIIGSMLAGVSPHDPYAIGAAVALLIVGALAAVVGPANRASRLDPAKILRNS